MKPTEALITKAYKAAVSLRNATDAQLKKTLMMLAAEMEKHTSKIIAANKKDVAKQDAVS